MSLTKYLIEIFLPDDTVSFQIQVASAVARRLTYKDIQKEYYLKNVKVGLKNNISYIAAICITSRLITSTGRVWIVDWGLYFYGATIDRMEKQTTCPSEKNLNFEIKWRFWGKKRNSIERTAVRAQTSTMAVKVLTTYNIIQSFSRR